MSTSCSGSKSRFRHKKRSLLSRLLNTITSADCSLATAQEHLDQVDPDLDVIEADWVVIGGLASDSREEEKEEEEEEEKESQSAEEKKASETATSNVESSTLSSTRASSTSSSSASSAFSSIVSIEPNSHYDGIIQGYPEEYFDPKAADDAIFAVAAAALSEIMGSSNSSTTQTAGFNTSMTWGTAGVAHLTTSVDSQTPTYRIPAPQQLLSLRKYQTP